MIAKHRFAHSLVMGVQQLSRASGFAGNGELRSQCTLPGETDYKGVEDFPMSRRSTQTVLFLSIAAMLSIAVTCVYGVNGEAAIRAEADKSASARKKSEHVEYGTREPFLIYDHYPYIARLRREGWFFNDVRHSDPSKTLKQFKRGAHDYRVHTRICQSSTSMQLRQAKIFKAYSDSTDIWIFHNISKNAPTNRDTIWPRYDNPVINQVRDVRAAVPKHKLFATGYSKNGVSPNTIDVIWGITRYRKPMFDELKWQLLAVIGANYDGFLWGQLSGNEKLKSLVKGIGEHLADIGSARIVPWTQVSDDQPVSVLLSDKKLFVVLLNPAYMTLSSDGKRIKVPISGIRRSGQLTLKIPSEYKIESGKYLSGVPVRVRREKGGVHIDYRYSGGGELLVFSITHSPPATRPGRVKSKSKADKAKE